MASFAAVLATSAVARRAVVDPSFKRRSEIAIPADAMKSPGPDVARLIALEFPNGLADVLWLGLVQIIGGRPTPDQSAEWNRLERGADLATDLDPKYFVVYYASAVNLTIWGQRPSSSDQLLTKGMSYLPDRWQLPFLLGYNAYFLHGDPMGASDYWELGVGMPDSPRYMPSLVARARFQSGDEAGSIMLLESMIPDLEEPQKTDAIVRLKILRSEPRMRRYDDACARYKAEHSGEVPTAEQLHRDKYVDEPPVNELDEAIVIKPNCRAYSATIVIREDDAARQRVGSQKKVDLSPELISP
jgi:hypothetical protein